jgi:hypothetical protein
MPADDATLDDLATAAATLYRLEIRRQSFAVDLPASWYDAVDAMGEDLRRVQRALIAAHVRESGEPPSRYLSTSKARRCDYDVMDVEASHAAEAEVIAMCGKPSGWRFLDPGDCSARYACPEHEHDLRHDAEAAGARIEQLLT